MRGKTLPPDANGATRVRQILYLLCSTNRVPYYPTYKYVRRIQYTCMYIYISADFTCNVRSVRFTIRIRSTTRLKNGSSVRNSTVPYYGVPVHYYRRVSCYEASQGQVQQFPHLVGTATIYSVRTYCTKTHSGPFLDHCLLLFPLGQQSFLF